LTSWRSIRILLHTVSYICNKHKNSLQKENFVFKLKKFFPVKLVGTGVSNLFSTKGHSHYCGLVRGLHT
jgi:hypothetical protein